MCNVSCVTCHVSSVPCCVLRVTCHLSHVTNINSPSHRPSYCLLPHYAQKGGLWIPILFYRQKIIQKLNFFCIFLQPIISDSPFDQRSLVHREVLFQAVNRRTNTRTSQLIDWIGPVGHFSKKKINPVIFVLLIGATLIKFCICLPNIFYVIQQPTHFLEIKTEELL